MIKAGQIWKEVIGAAEAVYLILSTYDINDTAKCYIIWSLDQEEIGSIYYWNIDDITRADINLSRCCDGDWD